MRELLTEIGWAIRHVLGSPARLRFLLAGGPRGARAMSRFLRTIVPLASAALTELEQAASRIPDPQLRDEALTSVRNKAYHVAGGCILATFLPADKAKQYIEIVAPLETIYDYLDNLCDRHPNVDPQAFPVLHWALADALDPAAPPHDYYALGPGGDDGGYLAMLVARVQNGIRPLAGHERLKPLFAEAATYYSELQTYKHLPVFERYEACIAWYERHRERFADLLWFEFAAAAGSQFQVYVPLYLLFAGHAEAVQAGYNAYFPPVSTLHVLLDAFIDQAEDREHGELNLFGEYADESIANERATTLASSAYRAFRELPKPAYHRFVLRTMALFYLTHPKVFAQGLNTKAVRLLSCFRSGK
jgi:tetraprenyl-beta-curcumene synthase